MASPKHAIGGLVRGGAAPFRNYFNSHFEMTKDEVRRAVAEVNISPPLDSFLSRNVTELSNVVAETELYQSRLIGKMRGDIDTLSDRVVEMSATLDQLTAVIAALVDKRDPSERA